MKAACRLVVGIVQGVFWGIGLYFFSFSVKAQTAQQLENVPLDAQDATAYYLNDREIAPQSFQFLNPENIDSIKVHVDQATGDSSIVAYTKEEHRILTYDEVLEYFFVKQSARGLPVKTTYSSRVEDPEKLVFSIDRIISVGIITDNFEEKGVFLQGVWLSLDSSSAVGSMMDKINRQFNN